MPDFDTKVNKEPLVLLDRIEQLMHTPKRAKYPLLTILEILCNFLKCKQGEKKSLVDYMSRFKSERDVNFRIMGKIFLDGFAENSPEWENDWSDDKKRKSKENELKKFLSVLFLRNADYATYNKLLLECRKSYANKIDIYPKCLEGIIDVMRQVTPKKRKSNNNRNSNGNDSISNDKDKEI